MTKYEDPISKVMDDLERRLEYWKQEADLSYATLLGIVVDLAFKLLLEMHSLKEDEDDE